MIVFIVLLIKLTSLILKNFETLIRQRHQLVLYSVFFLQQYINTFSSFHIKQHFSLQSLLSVRFSVYMSCIMVGQFCNSTSGLDQPLHQNSQRRYIHHLALLHSRNATVLQSYDGHTGCTMFAEKIVTISHGRRKAVVRIRTAVVRFAAVLMEILRQRARLPQVGRAFYVRLSYG
jgi:hypothetical protein